MTETATKQCPECRQSYTAVLGTDPLEDHDCTGDNVNVIQVVLTDGALADDSIVLDKG